jgi:ubiquitin-activating enzyme E1
MGSLNTTIYWILKDALCFAAKNVILAGVRALTIHDKKHVEKCDLSAQFFLTEEDVGKNRAEACKDRLQELNTAVAVSASSVELSDDFLKKFQVRHLMSLSIHEKLNYLLFNVSGCRHGII